MNARRPDKQARAKPRQPRLGPLPPPDPWAQPDEADEYGEACRPELPGYLISRHPVTVAQWRAFDAAWRARNGAWELTRPDGRWSVDLDERSLDAPATRPVVYVSFWDALAYCRWLEQQLLAAIELGTPTVPRALSEALIEGWRVTLPSEAEWEKGARGLDGRRYPWKGPGDDTWDEKRDGDCVNSADKDWHMVIGATSAVGAFPGGESPYGLEDTSGNVWEWTRSIYDTQRYPYPYHPDYRGRARENVRVPNDVLRVVRGGSFLAHPLLVRSACRDPYPPRLRGDGLGCRVAVSPFKGLDPLISGDSEL